MTSSRHVLPAYKDLSGSSGGKFQGGSWLSQTRPSLGGGIPDSAGLFLPTPSVWRFQRKQEGNLEKGANSRPRNYLEVLDCQVHEGGDEGTLLREHLINGKRHV